MNGVKHQILVERWLAFGNAATMPRLEARRRYARAKAAHGEQAVQDDVTAR